MRTKSIACFLSAAALLAVGLTACVTEKGEEKESEAKLQSQAKISRADAERTALTKVPGGKIKDAELEEEGGKLIYSFDIATPGTKDITEVHVDAKTGAIISVEKETAAAEAKEKNSEKSEK